MTGIYSDFTVERERLGETGKLERLELDSETETTLDSDYVCFLISNYAKWNMQSRFLDMIWQ